MRKSIKNLFKNLCCSICRAEFDENSFKTIREENGLKVAELECKNCGKNFGTVFLGYSKNNSKSSDNIELEVQEGHEPINYDDVIDAHKFIKDLDEHWNEFLDDN